MSRYLAIHALALIGALACSSVANAIPVTPGGYENVAGASDNCIPFTCRGVTRYQQTLSRRWASFASAPLGRIDQTIILIGHIKVCRIDEIAALGWI